MTIIWVVAAFFLGFALGGYLMLRRVRKDQEEHL